MANETVANKIWRVVYPVITHMIVYALIVFGGSLILSNIYHDTESYSKALISNTALLTSIASAITIVILYIFYKRDRVKNSNVIFKKPFYIILIIILGAALCHGLSLLISLFSNAKMIEDYQTVENSLFGASPVMVIIMTVVLAPLCEELIFRGLMFRRLKEYSNFWVAALLSSLTFGVYHLNLAQGIYAFLFGLVLCFVYDRTKHILAPIIIHAAGNLVSIILSYTGISYSSETVYYFVMVITLLASSAICFFIINRINAKETE